MIAVMEKEITLKSPAGFPTVVYFDMLDYLKKHGYTIKKTKDWLEINPRSTYYQEMLQKKQAVEQSVARIMINISDMRKDIELIKHDLRRLEEVLDHFKEKDEHILKSDFVDLVDRNTEALSLISLATTGKFPTVVVDFYKISSEEDIKKLKISETERGILKKKWRLYEYWKKKYGVEIEEKVKMLREQLNGRKASLNAYKEMLEPYIRGIKKIRISEEGYTTLDNPALIEGYHTAVAGVELSAWRGVSTRGGTEERYKYKEGEKKFPFYCYFDIKISRAELLVKEKHGEKMTITIKSHVKTGLEIEEIEKNIKKMDELMWKEIEHFKGEEWKEEEEKETSVLLDKLDKAFRRLIGKPKEGRYYIPKGIEAKGLESELKRVAEKETLDFYDKIKDLIGGLKFKRWVVE